jgi:hypothetical protein
MTANKTAAQEKFLAAIEITDVALWIRNGGTVRDTEEYRMGRPAIFTDLPEEKRRGDTVIDIALSKLPLELFGKAADLLTVAVKAGLLADPDHNYHLRAYAPLTEVQQDKAVVEYAERFDNLADRYDAIVATQSGKPEWNDAYGLEYTFCERTKLPLPWTL